MAASVNLSSRDINNAFEEGLGSYKSVASQICKLVIDSLSTVKYNGLYRPPLPIQWTSPSGRTFKGALSQSYSVQNLTYESTLVFSGQDFDGDQTGQIMNSISQFGQMDPIHDDVLLASALDNGGTNTAAFNTLNFFSSSHVLSNAATQANTAGGGNLTETGLSDADAAAVVSFGMAKLWNLKDFSNVSVPHNLVGRTAIICPTPAYAAINRYVNGGIVYGSGAGISQVGMDQTLVYKLPMLTGNNVYFMALDGRPAFILQKQSAKPEIKDWTNGWQHRLVEEDNYIVSFKMRKALAYFDHFSIFQVTYT